MLAHGDAAREAARRVGGARLHRHGPNGRPTQLSKTIRGGKRDAQRVAAELEVGPGRSSSAGRRVSDVLDAWVDQNLATWAPSSARDQQSRVSGIKKDQIASVPIARLSVGDVERWHTRLRRDGMGDAGIKNQHGVLRAALAQAVRWGWVSTNVAGLARLRSTKTQRRTVMTLDDVRAVMAAAASIDPRRRAHASHRRRLRRSASRARRAAVDRPARRDADDRLGDRGHEPRRRSARPPRRRHEDRQHPQHHPRRRHDHGDRGRCVPSASRTARGCSASDPSS